MTNKIAFAKIGKSLKFAGKFSPIGGDNEGPALLRILANNNPDKTFYLVGRSDFQKLSEEQRLALFPYDNVIDCYVNHKPKSFTTVVDFFKEQGFQPDAFVVMVGQVGTVTIPGMIKQVHNPDLIASVIDMTVGYTSPITYWMNETRPRIIEVINDPRYDLSQSRDIIPHPTVSLSQFNYSYTKNSIQSYENQSRVEVQVPVKYAEMEKIFLYDRKVEDIDVSKRTTNMMIVLNEGKPSRYEMLKTYILNQINDIEIYGSWENEAALKDSRFKGSLQLEDLQNKLKSVRCSFIIPIAPGWITSKYIELIHAGVVPIFHPSYDAQNILDYPEALRATSPEAVKKIAAALEVDSFYESVISALRRKYLHSSLTDGSRLNQIIMKEIDPQYSPIDISKFQKKIPKPQGLEGFFS